MRGQSDTLGYTSGTGPCASKSKRPSQAPHADYVEGGPGEHRARITRGAGGWGRAFRA